MERFGRDDCTCDETCLGPRRELVARRERKKDGDRELDEEVQADFALAIQQRVEAGATREEAESAARRNIGNITESRRSCATCGDGHLLKEPDMAKKRTCTGGSSLRLADTTHQQPA